MRDIKIRYSAIDGAAKTKTFKTLAKAKAYAVDRVGTGPEIGSSYAVSSDGVGKIRIEGCTWQELFPDCFGAVRVEPPAWLPPYGEEDQMPDEQWDAYVLARAGKMSEEDYMGRFYPDYARVGMQLCLPFGQEALQRRYPEEFLDGPF